ncbi:unnamed protein product [Trichobilharzia regenti]|nr:unnamed protein product [Trichobilharzia regenti]
MAEPRQTYVNLGPELPAENEFLRGKALLQSMHSSCGAGGGGIGGPKLHDENRQSDPRTGNLYEHLVTLLKLILETQPTHALDQFEMLSYQVKRERGGGTGGSGAGAGLVQEDTEARAPTEEPVSADYKHVKIEGTLLKSALPTNWGGIFDNEDEIQRLQNLGITSFLIEQGGIGLGRTEMLRVWLSIRKLSLKLKTIVKLRFWGKIMGTESSYYIAEGEFEAEMPPDDGVPAPYEKGSSSNSAIINPLILAYNSVSKGKLELYHKVFRIRSTKRRNGQNNIVEIISSREILPLNALFE